MPPSAPAAPRRPLLTFLAVVSIAAASVAAGYCAGRGGRAREEAGSAAVVEAVRRVAKLATVEMQVADVVKYEEVRTFVVFDVPKNATLRVRGTVLGGFDLDRGVSVVAEPATRTLRVDLPPPQVLSVDARVEWFDERSGWLNPITPEDRTRWTTWARGALGRAAKDAGIADRATAHARELFSRTAEAFGWKAAVTVAGQAPPEL